MQRLNNRRWVLGDRLVGTIRDEDTKVTYYQVQVNAIKGGWVTVLVQDTKVVQRKQIMSQGDSDFIMINHTIYRLWDTPEMEAYLTAREMDDPEESLSKLFGAANEAADASVCRAQATADKKYDEFRRAYIATMKEREKGYAA